MEKQGLIYQGKAKKVYHTEEEDKVIIAYKDDATAFNSLKKDTLEGKGLLNNQIASLIFKYVSEKGIPTHFIEQLTPTEQLAYKVDIIPLEVICRNLIAGSMAQRLGIEEGTVPACTIFEICYKNDALQDPLINDDHAVALGFISREELKYIYALTGQLNGLLKVLFDKMGIILVDFKVEFGKNNAGKILLSDEISPDTCRLWDKNTLKKLDKDRFRRDLGGLQDAYAEVLNRLHQNLN